MAELTSAWPRPTGPTLRGGLQEFNLQQPTTGRAAKGALARTSLARRRGRAAVETSAPGPDIGRWYEGTVTMASTCLLASQLAKSGPERFITSGTTTLAQPLPSQRTPTTSLQMRT